MEEEDRYTRITLRIPKDLHAKLQAAADDSSKSMNAEIIERVENSFSAPNPSTAISAINRLEADLSDKDTQLDETERLALLMATALAGTYGITRLALTAPSEDMGKVQNVLDAGMSAARSFASSYTPKGMEALTKRIEPLKNYLDAEAYENLLKSVTISDKTNAMLRQSEEAALAIIQKTLDKYDIQEIPHARRFTLFASIKNMPGSDQAFGDAVQSGDSDEPVVIEERKRRGLDVTQKPKKPAPKK